MELMDQNQLVKQTYNIDERHLRQSWEKQLWNQYFAMVQNIWMSDTHAVWYIRILSWHWNEK